MYRATTSFTTNDYDVRFKEILEDNFTTPEQIAEYLRIGYIEEYDGTLEITENGQYDVEDYQIADVDVPSGEPTLQSKSVTITQNGTTTVTADSGYDGLSEVEVEVNVGGGAPDWSILGYQSDEVPPDILADISYSKSIKDNWNPATVSIYQKYYGNKQLKYYPVVDMSNVTAIANAFYSCSNLIKTPAFNTKPIDQAYGVFSGCENLQEVGFIDTSTAWKLQNMFSGCAKLPAIPSWLITTNVQDMSNSFRHCDIITFIPTTIDTQNVTNMSGTWAFCNALEDVPQLNTGKVTNFQSVFQNCPNLTEQSLNNILAMCINASAYIAQGTNLTLKYLGLSQAQATTCQSLSNWDAFVAAGWSSGY